MDSCALQGKRPRQATTCLGCSVGLQGLLWRHWKKAAGPRERHFTGDFVNYIGIILWLGVQLFETQRNSANSAWPVWYLVALKKRVTSFRLKSRKVDSRTGWPWERSSRGDRFGVEREAGCLDDEFCTPPKFNIAPEKWWLEDEFPFGIAYF